MVHVYSIVLSIYIIVIAWLFKSMQRKSMYAQNVHAQYMHTLAHHMHAYVQEPTDLSYLCKKHFEDDCLLSAIQQASGILGSGKGHVSSFQEVW